MKKCYSCGKDLNGSLYKHTTVPAVSESLIKPYSRKAIKTKRIYTRGIIINEYCNVECYDNKTP